MTTESSDTTKKGRRAQLRRIVVSEHNYFALKKLGYAGDSFNDVISRLLLIEKNYREMKKKNNDRRTMIIIVMIAILRVSLSPHLVLPQCFLSKIILICRI
jgi:predicted CopG family antitoxin